MLVLLRLLHHTTVVTQRIVSTELLEELGIDLVVICIKLPLVESKSSHCTLVAHVEDDLVVDIDAVVQPLDFRRCHTGVAIASQEQMSLGMLFLILSVKIFAA